MDLKRIQSPGTSIVQDAVFENFFKPFLDPYIMVITGYSNDILDFLKSGFDMGPTRLHSIHVRCSHRSDCSLNLITSFARCSKIGGPWDLGPI